MKRLLKIVVCLIACIICFGLTGCFGTSNNNGSGQSSVENDYIELTIDNYDYYLTIDDSVVSNFTAASTRFYCHRVTIYGALSGIYSDCVLHYKYNGNEMEVKLNVAGYATFDYTVSSGRLVYTRVSGKIYL